MREIKFRAWSGHYGHMQYNIQSAKPSFGEWDCFSYYLTNEIYIVMQYTGLKDKNGKEGYHKDIWTDGLNKYLVEWCDKKAGFILKGIIINREYSMAHFPEGKIIGNIYENSELIEK